MTPARLRDFTLARVGLGRVGNSLPTRELLDFQLAHARARDAVHAKLDSSSLALELDEKGIKSLTVRSAAPDRATYLRRPDLGRRLAEPLGVVGMGCDAVFIIADGLSALAIHRHAIPLLERVLPHFDESPVVIVEQGRVAIGDEIGAAFQAELSVVLIGERPGLSSPDSMGVYLTWHPKPGLTDADRNCISNIHAEGLSYDAAAQQLVLLMNESRRRKLSGVQLSRQCRIGTK